MSQTIPTNAQVTTYGHIFRHENGVVFIHMHDDISIDLAQAQKLVTDVRALDNSGQAKLLIVQGKNNDLTFESQRYLGTVNGVTHLALVVKSRIQADVAQFFLKLLQLLRSSYEMRVFYQVSQAEAWLLSAR